jgi:hypothetical protein
MYCLVRVFFPVLLIATLAACGRNASQEGAATERTSEGAAPARTGLASLLPPHDGSLPWEMVDGPRRFGPGNLWEVINGAAEEYLAYGFEELVTADYREKDGREATVEIYRMGEPTEAFGIFAQETSAGSTSVEVGTEGRSSGNAVAFWSGPHYVKVTAFQAADQDQDLVVLARAVAERIGPKGSPPEQLRHFPQEGLVEGSQRYIPKDVLGQSYLGRAFEAQYLDASTRWKLTVAQFEDESAALEGLESYKGFVAANGKVLEERKTPADGGFVGQEAYYGRLIAIRSGSLLLVALGPPSREIGLSRIDGYLGRAR